VLHYQQNFSNSKSLLDFQFNNPGDWGLFNTKGNFYLQNSGTDTISIKNGLPSNLAVLNQMTYGDFILEASVYADSDTSGFFNVCFVLGLKSKEQYYYIKISNRNDSADFGIFVLKQTLHKKLTGTVAPAVKWERNKWHKVRIERNIVERTIEVYIDNNTQPVLRTKDYELVMGCVGYGSVSNPCRIDDIKIWAPTVIPEKTQVF